MLGPDRPNCQRVRERAAAALETGRKENRGLEATIRYISESALISRYPNPIQGTPALVINETLICAGRIPQEDEISGWLREAANATKRNGNTTTQGEPTMSDENSPSAHGQAGLSLVSKLLPAWIVLAMAAGLLLGRFLPQVGKALEPGISLGLFVMIFPAMTKLELGRIRGALRDWKAAAIVIFFNYAFNPFLLYLFGWFFLRNHPDLWTGLVLLGVAPCIAMVLVWTDLARGNGPLGIVLMAWNSLIQIVTTPFFIWLILGARVSVDLRLVAQSVLLYLGLPLLTGALARRWMLRTKGQVWFERRALPVLDDVQLVALLLTLVVMFALKGDVIVQNPELIALMVPPLVLFFFVLFFGVLVVSRRVGFCYADSATTSFHCTGRNFELAIAIALTAFAARPMVAVSTVIGPLIEVPLMLTIVYLARKAEWKLFGTNSAGACRVQEARAERMRTRGTAQ